MLFISLEINIGTSEKMDWQYAVLKSDVSISIESISSIWDTSAGGGAYSYEFNLPVEENLHILGNSCDMRGKSIYSRLYGKRFRLYAGGLCLFYGIVKLDESVEIEEDDNGDHTVGITLNADGWEWDELLDGINARDVELASVTTDIIFDEDKYTIEKNYLVENKNIDINDVFIGYCIPSYYPLRVDCAGVCSDDAGAEGKGNIEQKKDHVNIGMYIPKVMIPLQGDRDKAPKTNVSEPYPDAKYCNVTICYQHYQDTGDNNWEPKRGYSVGKYDRINSAPCFYVMYWMELLFKALNISIPIQDNAMYNYTDMKRLAFYHTDCKYVEIEPDKKFKLKEMNLDFSDGKNWQHNEDNTVHYKRSTDKGDDCWDVRNMVISEEIAQVDDDKKHKPTVNTDRIAFAFSIGPMSNSCVWPFDQTGGLKRVDWKMVGFTAGGIEGGYVENKSIKLGIVNTVNLYEAYATSENFPNTDAKEILEGLQNAFGIRYLYNAEEKSLKIVFVKDILAQSVSENIPCEVHKITKTENHVTGFRLKYSATEDAASNAITQQEELTGVKQGTEGSDTTYSYNNYTNPRILDMEGTGVYGNNDNLYKMGYGWLLNHTASANYDKACYIHPVTGNAFRIKVDGDSNGGSTLYPSLFEVGQFQKAEWGNCSTSKNNSDFVEEVSIGFTPIIENDVNCKAEKLDNPDTNEFADGQSLAILLGDGEIRSYTDVDTEGNENGDSMVGYFITSSVNYELPLKSYEAYPTKYAANNTQKHRKTVMTPIINTTLYLSGVEMWDLANEEPTNTNDTGFVLGIMRGKGSEAHTEEYNYGYDGKSNHSIWKNLPGTEPSFSADNIDQYGNYYDYNGGFSPIITRRNISKVIEENFPYCKAKLNSLARAHESGKLYLYKEEAINKGYCEDAAFMPEYTAEYYKVDISLTGGRTRTYYAVVLGTDENRVISTHEETEARARQIVQAWNNGNKNTNESMWPYFVSVCDTEEEAKRDMRIIHFIYRVVFENQEFDINDYSYIKYTQEYNGLGYEISESISLRLRAEKLNPGYNPNFRNGIYDSAKGTYTVGKYTYINNGEKVVFSNGTIVPNTKYFPISKECARRGLAEKFYEDYAYWVLNRRIANITVTMELATLVNIDMTKKYVICGYEGFIKQLSYTLNNETGLSPVDIEFYYI